jgi:UDP:flavonoid glycosyltransferase YjiC (YdhE family)
MQSLQAGIPMLVAGTGQDKNVTNVLVEMKEVGVNLGTQNPSVHAIRDGVAEVLGNEKYKRNAVAMSEVFKTYDMATVIDGVIQEEVKKWFVEKRKGKMDKVH